jgi:hypothetical protein
MIRTTSIGLVLAAVLAFGCGPTTGGKGGGATAKDASGKTLTDRNYPKMRSP